MCRILIYGCHAVEQKITTEGVQTLIPCRQITDSKEDKKNEINQEFDAEIVITHAQFPESHKLVFIESVKEEELEDKCESEGLGEMVVPIEPYSPKEESDRLR